VLIRLENIKPEGLFLDFEEAAENFPVLRELSATGECSFPGRVKVRLKLFRIGETVEMKGLAVTPALFSCSRCLDDVEVDISTDFSLIYFPEKGPKEEEEEPDEIELAEDDLGVVYFSGDTIDPLEAVQEHILMALPLQPLCEEGCKGLCPQCGNNLNRETCSCDPPVFNNKFSSLKDFFKP